MFLGFETISLEVVNMTIGWAIVLVATMCFANQAKHKGLWFAAIGFVTVISLYVASR